VKSAVRENVSPEDAAWLDRAAAWRDDIGFKDLAAGRLAAIAHAEGIEFATALLYDRALRDPANAAFQRRILEADAQRSLRPDIIGVVPGAFHGQHKHTGADGLKIAETVSGLAPRIEIIPVRSFGPLEENARGILDWLEARRGQRIVLTSLSKGSADVKCALASPRAAAAFTSVVSWVSFSGIVQGTPLVAWLRARPLRSSAFGLLLRLQGHRSAVIDELRRGEDAPLWSWPAPPPHLRIVHVNACPLRHHLRHRWAPRGYERVLPLGPNDGGGILLGDLAQLPGVVCPIWGADHYLQPSWDVTPVLRAVVVAALAPEWASRHANQSAAPPRAAPASKSTA
jgi:hypothetical protein